MSNERTMRTCSKTACRWPAAASLSYRYDTRQVWLLDLSDEPDPSLYDLCPHHADNLVVMRGWESVDQRTTSEPIAEPAGRDLLPESGHPPVGAGGYGGNRYRALVDDLPRLAADLARHEDEETAPRGHGSGATLPAGARTVEVPVVPSRDLAPMPPPSAPAPALSGPAAPPPPLVGEAARTAAVEHDGEAVVVSISSAARRRDGD